MNAKEVVVHPNFKNKNAEYYNNKSNVYHAYSFDYCLVKIDPIDMERINNGASEPGKIIVANARLAEREVPFSIGVEKEIKSDTTCSIVGWGQVHTIGKQSPVLREADVELMSSAYCNDLGNNYTGDSADRTKKTYGAVRGVHSFCAGETRGFTDTCWGDSGGPLFCKVDNEWRLVGITSHGPPTGVCGRAGLPGIYAKISYIIPWIQNITGCKCLNNDK